MYKLCSGQAQYKQEIRGSIPGRGTTDFVRQFLFVYIYIYIYIYIYNHFDLYLTPVTLTFTLLKNVSNGTFPPQGQQLCRIVLKSMHYCTSYGPDKSGRTDVRTDARTHIHRTKIVLSMSRLPASGLD